VHLKNTEPGLTITLHVSEQSNLADGEGFSSLSPSGWENQPGFFCVIDNNDIVWAFDGGEELLVVEKHGDGTRLWDFNCPLKIPAEAKTRLPPELIKKKQNKSEMATPRKPSDQF
jgi:hypothetical protein